MKKLYSLLLLALLIGILYGCGQDENADATDNTDTNEEETSDSQSVTYLDKEYEIPSEVDSIVTASLESMEDAAMLGVQPTGVLAIANEVPSYLAEDFEDPTLIGDKREPNHEVIATLEPDVILGSSKFQEPVAEKLSKIQTTLPYSHISSDWEDNLLLMGQLTNKEAEAQTIIDNYKQDAEGLSSQISGEMADKDVLIIRVRSGSMFVYPEDVYLNPVLYKDLGIEVPEVIKNTEAQAELSMETLAEIDPDTVFLQFDTSENAESPEALDELIEDPIFQSTTAAKDDNIHVNTVEPLAQGGTAWSKVHFLEALNELYAE
ncbi:iron-uptake system iron-binding protein [Oceanobacillus iheyensis HTE831]|uniref:Iron-uptake system iron-binding protein n=1 Tax=Oceanobacillus iheyensis (strain DSM 14371 / CIP 107618 / JCM 11309 / KCTC 3954 / HTE831) TaxID=221109 RepID=Q8ESD0_OCEIH|nr:iron-hydroxamate ABC transporter substrate-binding protein [Oceanobacillus iheyensis]BAC12666.1 iron-uptake system iron-binding protein [Oceanobacillus iheyensis HTE831]